MSGQGPAVWESYKTISLAVQKHPFSNETDNMFCEYKERLQVLLTTVSRTVSASSKATFTYQALMFRFSFLLISNILPYLQEYIKEKKKIAKEAFISYSQRTIVDRSSAALSKKSATGNE